LFFVSCVFLIATVLLQPGKTDAGALFTSNISSSAFGPRGTASVLSKITIVAASVFMVSAFLISVPAFQGGVSVLQTVGEPTVGPATEQAIPANTDANGVVEQEQTQPVTNEEAGLEAPAANEVPANTAPANSGESPSNN
jgi:preprotein translocase subunit SecG